MLNGSTHPGLRDVTVFKASPRICTAGSILAGFPHLVGLALAGLSLCRPFGARDRQARRGDQSIDLKMPAVARRSRVSKSRLRPTFLACNSMIMRQATAN